MRFASACRSVPAVSILFLILAAASGCGGGAPREETAAPAGGGSLQQGMGPAPDFTLESLQGGTLSLSETHGQVRILDFWATWCKPCIHEMPMYQEIHEEWGDKGVQVISISIDEDGAEVVRPFVEKNGITYTVLLGNEQVEIDYREVGHVGVPSTYVLDAEGKIVKHYTGAKPKKILVGLIRDLLSEEG